MRVGDTASDRIGRVTRRPFVLEFHPIHAYIFHQLAVAKTLRLTPNFKAATVGRGHSRWGWWGSGSGSGSSSGSGGWIGLSLLRWCCRSCRRSRDLQHLTQAYYVWFF